MKSGVLNDTEDVRSIEGQSTPKIRFISLKVTVGNQRVVIIRVSIEASTILSQIRNEANEMKFNLA